MLLTEIDISPYITTFITVSITLFIGWVGSQFAKVFKGINQSSETNAKLEAHIVKYEKDMDKIDLKLTDLQKQINEL